MDYDNGQQNQITSHTSVISDDKYDDPPPKHSKRSFWYRLTGLLIGRKQAEEEAKQGIHHSSNTDFNLNVPANSPKMVVIEEQEQKQPTTPASELLGYHHRFGYI